MTGLIRLYERLIDERNDYTKRLLRKRIRLLQKLDRMGKMDDQTKANIEIIYGLLWLMPVNMETQAGMAAHLARKVALDMIDKDGQARGIETAKRAVRGNMLKWASTKASAEINHTPRAG